MDIKRERQRVTSSFSGTLSVSFKSGVVLYCLAPLPCVSVNELAQSSLGLSNQAIDTWPVLEESSWIAE